MKISEMTNEQATEAMIRIATPFGNLCNDQEFLDVLDEISAMDQNTNVFTVIGRYLPKVVLCAFKKHKDDLYEIVSALSMKSVAQVAKMNFKDTIQLVKDSYDDIIKDFFTSSGGSKKRTAEE